MILEKKLLISISPSLFFSSFVLTYKHSPTALRLQDDSWETKWVNEQLGSNIESPSTNVQKKMIPWDLLLENDTEFSRSYFRQRKRNDLIVVASLIDKLPNLGGSFPLSSHFFDQYTNCLVSGISRTCEIFNASKLVLHDLKAKDQAMFKALSVNAEKWLPFEEVPLSS